jgi:hypothetical protein
VAIDFSRDANTWFSLQPRTQDMNVLINLKYIYVSRAMSFGDSKNKRTVFTIRGD